MKPIRSYLQEDGSLVWPADAGECEQLGRALLLDAAVSKTRYWIEYASDFVLHRHPTKPHERNWSAVSKKDAAYREAFGSLTDAQRQKFLALIEECVKGAVFSTLCTFDQFPHGEAEINVSDGVCGEGTRKFRIAPTDVDLHDEFTQLLPDAILHH